MITSKIESLNFLNSNSQKITEIAQTMNDESAFKQIANSLHDLNSNITTSFENVKSIFYFFNKVGDFFKEATYWLSHPIELLGSIQPWLIVAMMCMIILRMIGFKPEKWFRLCFLLLIISLIF